MPPDAYCGRGSDTGPILFLTDELASQCEAVRSVWSDARQLLCLFHYLQHWWNWFWEAKQGVNIKDKKSSWSLSANFCVQQPQKT